MGASESIPEHSIHEFTVKVKSFVHKLPFMLSSFLGTQRKIFDSGCCAGQQGKGRGPQYLQREGPFGR